MSAHCCLLRSLSLRIERTHTDTEVGVHVVQFNTELPLLLLLLSVWVMLVVNERAVIVVEIIGKLLPIIPLLLSQL